MASKQTLNLKNLETLGVTRLAELLLELSAGNASAKRRLRLELAGAESADELAKEIRNRLTTIARSRSFVDWHNRKSLIADLESQRQAIVNQIAKQDAAQALELMWRFMVLAPSVFERCDDSSGAIISIFHVGCGDLGNLAVAAKSDEIKLADHAYEALMGNSYGQFDHLISVLAPPLGKAGLEHLKQRMTDLSQTPTPKPADDERKVIGWSTSGAARSRLQTVRSALQEIADASGDVDGFITQYTKQEQKVPVIAARIANRLLEVQREEEALKFLEQAEHRERGWPQFEWEDARIAVLDALGRAQDAQAARWSCFERSLSARHLRDYLKRLPDFEDVEIEVKALDHAEKCANVLQALFFMVSWPALDRAARSVLARASEIDGNGYEILTQAAEALAAKHPLAAILILRSMINFALIKGRSSRYGHAARHLLECQELASRVESFDAFEPHEAYVAKLQAEHGRKSSFWASVKM